MPADRFERRLAVPVAISTVGYSLLTIAE